MIRLLAYLVPATAALGMLWGGPWAWLTVIFVYGLVPVADALGSADATNLDDAGQQRAAASRWASLPLYLALPVQLG
ncbi:MAG: alkane 1-monooxygenase, partial [Gammaproteobacteria bacterium]|nr:alkane 1-monooxygenase [Gammaproteobacteria bacterium]